MNSLKSFSPTARSGLAAAKDRSGSGEIIDMVEQDSAARRIDAPAAPLPQSRVGDADFVYLEAHVTAARRPDTPAAPLPQCRVGDALFVDGVSWDTAARRLETPAALLPQPRGDDAVMVEIAERDTAARRLNAPAVTPLWPGGDAAEFVEVAEQDDVAARRLDAPTVPPLPRPHDDATVTLEAAASLCTGSGMATGDGGASVRANVARRMVVLVTLLVACLFGPGWRIGEASNPGPLNPLDDPEADGWPHEDSDCAADEDMTCCPGVGGASVVTRR